MYIKMVEIRDANTCIPAAAIRMAAADEIENRYLWRCGYPKDGSSIMLLRLADGKATNDPYEWESLGMGQRTMQVAHDWIIRNYRKIESGQVVDVEYILGESESPKFPEIMP